MRRHRFDPGSLLAGLYFLAMGGIFLATGLSGTPIMELEVLIPVVLCGLGVVGLVRVLTRSRRRDEDPGLSRQ